MLAWLDKWNEGKAYDDQIRPFGFLLSYTAKTGIFAKPCEATIIDMPRRGRPASPNVPKPIAPNDSDPRLALLNVFDRILGEGVGE